MAIQYDPIAKDESLNTTEATPRNIADVLAEEIGNLVSVVSRIAPQTVYDLDDLGDVDITSPSNGQVLKYNGTSQKWENGTGGGSGDSVSWSQIQQSGTKIAEIEINGQTTDVYAPTGGGGFSALIVITTATGRTVTVSKGGDTYTAVETSSGTYEVSVDSMGTWTVTDGTNTDTVAVSQQTTYYVTLSSVPDGRTVLPTDDVSIWLACGGRSEAYTTLSEVLNDSVCLSALIADSNAVDYLVRSTKWAGIQLVPDMTDNTHPSGECSADSNNANAYKGFINSGWESAGNSSYPHWLCYDFQTPTRIGKVEIWENGNYYGKTGSIQAYVNGAWEDIYTINKNSAGLYGAVIPSVVTAEKYRYNVTSGQSLSTAIDIKVYDIFLYSENLCDSEIAMTYIGLNNYCANKLLADATWRTAICNSAYFESVLNVKVPTMTDNTHPSGECYGTPLYADTPAWMAFDETTSNQARFSSSSDAKIAYGYPSAKKIFMAVSDSHAKYCAYHYSDDNATWNLIHASIQYSTRQKKFIFPTPVTSRYFRILMNGSIHSDGKTLWVYTCQFYGRADI